VDAVGHKEGYLFYRKKDTKPNDARDTLLKYNKDIAEVLESVEKNMEVLKHLLEELGTDADWGVIGELLVNLRYLCKHIAFKEEQECRIVRIHRLLIKDKNIKNEKIKNENPKQIYTEYDPKVSNHIEKIYFGPKFDEIEMELFKDIMTLNRLDIPPRKSESPLA
jgi:hypothetical protein